MVSHPQGGSIVPMVARSWPVCHQGVNITRVALPSPRPIPEVPPQLGGPVYPGVPVPACPTPAVALPPGSHHGGGMSCHQGSLSPGGPTTMMSLSPQCPHHHGVPPPRCPCHWCVPPPPCPCHWGVLTLRGPIMGCPHHQEVPPPLRPCHQGLLTLGSPITKVCLSPGCPCHHDVPVNRVSCAWGAPS